MFSDFRTLLAKSRQFRQHSRRRSHRPLSADKYHPFQESFPGRRRSGEKWAKIEAPDAALRGGKRPTFIADGCAAISGWPWGNHLQSTANPDVDLSGPWARLRIPHFRSHFQAAIGPMGAVPKLRHTLPRLGPGKRTAIIDDECSAIPGRPGGIMVNPPPL